jgi:hypothetical protein
MNKGTMPPQRSSSLESIESQYKAPREDKAGPLCLPVRRYVNFAPIVEVQETLHVADYSEEECRAVWYTMDELRIMQAGRMETVQAIAEHTFVEDSEHTARGIETPEERRRREQNTVLAIDCVLGEQDMQTEEDIDDPEYIALLYQYCCLCNQSARNAHRKALIDHAQFLEGKKEVKYEGISSVRGSSPCFDDNEGTSIEGSDPTKKGNHAGGSFKGGRGWQSNNAASIEVKTLSVPAA